MATTKQVQAAKRNIKRAQAAAKEKRSSPTCPTRPEPISASRQRRSPSASAPAPPHPRPAQELYDEAKRRNLPGRSKMGRDELARAPGPRMTPNEGARPCPATSEPA